MSVKHSSDGESVPRSGHSAAGADMNLKTIMLVGVAALIIFAVSVIWSYRLMVGREAELHATGMGRVPTEIGKPEIGIVDQIPFDIDHRLDVWRAAHARRLSSYGWVDRSKGIAHIPIEQAMQRVVAEPPDISGEDAPPAGRMPVTTGAPLPPLRAGSGASVPGQTALPAAREKPTRPPTPATTATPDNKTGGGKQ